MQIKIIDKDNIMITSPSNRVRKFSRKDMSGPERAWFDNIIDCSTSLMKDPFKK